MSDKAHNVVVSAQVLRRSLFVHGGLGSLKLLATGQVGITVALQLAGVFLDILFVQKFFTRGDELVFVPYTDLTERMRSFVDKSIMSKAVVAIAISYIVTEVLTDEAMRLVNQTFIVKHINPKYVDMGVTVIMNVLAAWLFLNLLKFRWAYVHNTDINTNFLVIAWFSILTILYTMRIAIRQLRDRNTVPSKCAKCTKRAKCAKCAKCATKAARKAG